MTGRAVRTAFILFAISILLSASVAAQDPVQILDIDEYDVTAVPSDVHTFNWTVRNVDPVAYNITIAVETIAGWTVDVVPPRIVALQPNRAAPVSVTVTAPDEVHEETVAKVTVRFTVEQDGAIVFLVTRTATVTIPSIYAEKKILGVFSNFLPAPLDNEWGVFLLNVVLWLGIAFLALFILNPVIKRAAQKSKTEIDDIVIRIVRTPLVVLLFLYGTIQSLNALDRHIEPAIRSTLFSIYQAALALVVIYVAYRLFKDVVVYLGKNLAKRTKSNVDDVIIPLVEKLGLVIIGFVGLGLLLGYLNVDLSLFIAGGVVISMVLAFAAQDTISNFFSGIFILTDRPFKEGDVVILSDGDWAEVRRVGMRTTRLFRFKDATIVTIPNNKMVNEKIANFSNPKDKARHMVTFNVGYGSDPAQVKQVIQDAIQATPHVILDDPNLKPVIRFDAMGESSLDFFVLLWIDERANRFTVKDVLNTEIYNRLNAAGIDIPFPQRTVHLKVEGDPGPRVPLDVERIARRVSGDATGPEETETM